MQDPRERLLRRVEVEARAFANSDGTTSRLRLGRVLGLLEAGVLAGYWRKRDPAAAAELVQHRYRLSKIRDVLLRGDEVKLWKVTDIAEFLGVLTQRVDQLALAGRFPPPSGRLGPCTLLGAIGRRGLGGGQLVGWGWPSLATQAIGERGSPGWKLAECGNSLGGYGPFMSPIFRTVIIVTVIAAAIAVLLIVLMPGT